MQQQLDAAHSSRAGPFALDRAALESEIKHSAIEVRHGQGEAVQVSGIARDASAARMSAADQRRLTFAAAGPFGPWTMSNSTASPSFRLL